MQNRLLQYYETTFNCMKDVSNCTPAVMESKMVQVEIFFSFRFVAASRKKIVPHKRNEL